MIKNKERKMTIIILDACKQVEGIEVKKRKKQIYNVFFQAPFNVKNLNEKENKLVATEFFLSNNNSVMLQRHFYNDGHIYYMGKHSQQETTCNDKSILSLLKNDKQYVFYESKKENIDFLLKQKYILKNPLINQNLKTVDIDNLKTIIDDNEKYSLKKCQDILDNNYAIQNNNLMFCSNTRIFEFTLNYGEQYDSIKRDFRNKFSLPICMIDAFQEEPIRTLFGSSNMIINDMSLINKKELYGKILYDICFGEQLKERIYSTGIMYSQELTAETFLNNLCDTLEQGDELKVLLSICKDNNYQLSDVNNAIKFMYKNLSNLSNSTNKIVVNYYKQKRNYPSDFDLFNSVITLFYNKMENILLSYHKNPLEKPCIFSNGKIIYNNDISNTLNNYNYV